MALYYPTYNNISPQILEIKEMTDITEIIHSELLDLTADITKGRRIVALARPIHTALLLDSDVQTLEWTMKRIHLEMLTASMAFCRPKHLVISLYTGFPTVFYREIIRMLTQEYPGITMHCEQLRNRDGDRHMSSHTPCLVIHYMDYMHRRV